MMSCEQAGEALAGLVFTELDDATHARLNEHLASCDACRVAEREWLALRDGVRGREGAFPDALAARVRTALVRETPARAPFWRRPVPAWAALAAVVACTALSVVMGPVRPRPRSGPVATFADTSSGVPMLVGDVTFNLAEPYDTRVHGVAEAVARRDTARERIRRDTL